VQGQELREGFILKTTAAIILKWFESISLPSRSHRLPEHWVHAEKELAELANKAKQWELRFDRIQMLELHLSVMYPVMSGESRVQTPRLADWDNLIPAIMQQDDERGMNILQAIHRRQGSETLSYDGRQAMQRSLCIVYVSRSEQ